ncbi:neurogenic locus notch homolog protein 1 isoform X2 [Brachyhypopomus gauderio]|uniref:neurogenic locus notch homolog protein 1 isoform X2 n=1 Tax=Brachyhypopomus gauderio TaxID=698409 RepID=UPI0040427017
MALLLGLVFTLWPVSRMCQALSDPWNSCPTDTACKAKFADGVCDKECTSPQCLRDGFDCVKAKDSCKPGYVQYCRDHYDNTYCEQSCKTASCGWDGSDCFQNQQPNWARGTLILQTSVPFQKGPFQNGSLLWALSVLLQTSVKLRGVVPFQTSTDLFSLEPQQLIELHQQLSTHKSNGSLLFLQVDNRACTHLPHTCFSYAAEAASFLSAVLELNHAPHLVQNELVTLIAIRGIDREVVVKETIAGVSSAWLWPVVGVASGMGVALAVVGVALLVWVRRRRRRRMGGERVRHRSTATDDNNGSKAWTRRSADQHKERSRRDREKDRNGAKKKKKKGKEAGKRRSEPLGEDAIRMRPLRKDLDIGSDTDMTQSSMEDITRTICDHRSPAQKHFDLSPQQPTAQAALPGRWERNPAPAQQRAATSTAPVQWCGPDGSVVLIRAVRSGLDRVVLELLRAGVPVNNTDHTGRSALHWACSVNHLSLARTLVRYGATVDQQDHKGETALFLAALHGCYETARFLLLNGANQELTDRRGRRPIDVAREALHHQVLELLLAHRVHLSPFPVDPATEVLWDDRTYLYSQWASPPSLAGRSASFSGVIGNRDLSSPPPSTDWLMSRAQCASAQNWRPMPTQSATALVSPRILGHPSRPISTLQEVTSEAEEEDREPQDVSQATMGHFLSPQPAPRQRSFSCTQHALQRHSSSNQSELPASVAPEKRANEHVEIVVMPHPKASPSQPESKSAALVTNTAQTDSERESKSCESKSDTVSNEPMSVQTVV